MNAQLVPRPDAPLRVLFIDDEARITRALKVLFRDYEVYTCNDPRQAPAIARQHDVDVVVCDQRMPEMTGPECLSEIRQAAPRAMRLLLTGFSDLKAVLGSVNEGEVFRFVNKPWDNRELRELVAAAGAIAREAPAVAIEPISAREQEEARQAVGVLVIEDDPNVQQRLREILQPYYQVRFATTAERALQILEQHETGVVISETEVEQGDLTGMLKTLKVYHPHIATVVVTERANAQLAMDLINEGQVYRMLIKPVRMGSCRLSVDSAIGRYWQLKKTPAAVKRFTVVRSANDGDVPARVNDSILARIRQLPSRLVSIARFSSIF
ncbi:MAG TPA: response regulator [Xanthomonadales bacterium]|nr:response regulator [Xanthomonadales bacterium]